jgi:hypothetical protein
MPTTGERIWRSPMLRLDAALVVAMVARAVSLQWRMGVADARWEEHRPAHGGGPGTQSPSELETRVLFADAKAARRDARQSIRLLRRLLALGL